MSELIRIGQGFFEDLATTPHTKACLLRDRQLSEQDFATKHADTILNHYMTIFRFDFLREDAEFFAATIWHYLQIHQQREHQVTTPRSPIQNTRLSGEPMARWPHPPQTWSLADCVGC